MADPEPFRVEILQEELDDLADRLRRTRWPDDFGNAMCLDANGNQRSEELDQGTQYRFIDSRAYNYIAKLTFLIDANQNLTLSLSGSPKTQRA